MFRQDNRTKSWRAMGARGWRAVSVLSILGLTLASAMEAGQAGQLEELQGQAQAPAVESATQISALPMEMGRAGQGATHPPPASADQVVGRQASEWIACAMGAAFAGMWSPAGLLGGIVCYFAVVHTWGE